LIEAGAAPQKIWRVDTSQWVILGNVDGLREVSGLSLPEDELVVAVFHSILVVIQAVPLL